MTANHIGDKPEHDPLNNNNYINIFRNTIIYFLFIILTNFLGFFLSVFKKNLKNVKIIKRKYIITNIDTQETDYSV
jgi:ascorbate-specific PTS system EIIC-type component UlaA